MWVVVHAHGLQIGRRGMMSLLALPGGISDEFMIQPQQDDIRKLAVVLPQPLQQMRYGQRVRQTLPECLLVNPISDVACLRPKFFGEALDLRAIMKHP